MMLYTSGKQPLLTIGKGANLLRLVLPVEVIVPEWFLEVLRIDISDFSMEDRRLFNKALVISFKYHSGVYRKSGETYFVHDLRCALRALKGGLGLTVATVMLLHEFIEDDGWSKRRLVRQFNRNIANMVDAVSKRPKERFIDRLVRLKDHIRRIMHWILIIWQVLMAKLIDRLDNTHDTDRLTDEERDRLFLETLEYFIPMFERFRYLIPQEHRVVYDVWLLELKITCGNHIRAKLRENQEKCQLSLPLE